MSDSEDDKPLAARNIAVKQSAAATNTGNAATSSKPSSVSASNPQDAIKRKAAQKAPVIDTSDSGDDRPLLTRAKPAVRPGDHCSKTTVCRARKTVSAVLPVLCSSRCKRIVISAGSSGAVKRNSSNADAQKEMVFITNFGSLHVMTVLELAVFMSFACSQSPSQLLSRRRL